ncbi:glycosyltransferase family 1 protein [Pedobacter sp. SYSU D00535]|uniref:glycosyltransferase family 4 protein n=1 Tax=Pedobacter sp. SYSU D00535 TaxID=2810308 RepID=UPI001A9629F9|nr:glycosyltransferase family 1 protein [Pedobacter sp. SYSU D00535]
MRIGFDGKRAIQNFTGLGNYSRFVLDLLARHYSDYRYYLYTAKRPKENYGIPENIQFVHPKRYKNSAIWRTFTILRNLKKDKIDLYHGLSNELPIGISKSGIASVVTIHDLIFLRFPDFYSPIDRAIYKFKFKYACQHATRIIAVSEQTKADIVSFFKISPEKIDVVYQGCNVAFQQKASEREKVNIRSEYHLPAKYLLHVGTIEERKNLMLIVKALPKVSADVKLVVIGRETDYAAEVREFIQSNNLTERVIFLKNVPLKDLPTIYQLAEMFIYPSEFEGFGIPIIEALYSGVPVIAATGSCLEEAGGPGACYVHPKDEVQLGYCINNILNRPDVREEMVKMGYQHVENFSESRLAANLINTYTKALYNA